MGTLGSAAGWRRCPAVRTAAVGSAALCLLASLTACVAHDVTPQTGSLEVEVFVDVCDGTTCASVHLPEPRVTWELNGRRYEGATDQDSKVSVAVAGSGQGTGSVTWGKQTSRFEFDIVPGGGNNTTVWMPERAFVKHGEQ